MAIILMNSDEHKQTAAFFRRKHRVGRRQANLVESSKLGGEQALHSLSRQGHPRAERSAHRKRNGCENTGSVRTCWCLRVCYRRLGVEHGEKLKTACWKSVESLLESSLRSYRKWGLSRTCFYGARSHF